MKIKKSFVVVFIFSFISGYAAVLFFVKAITPPTIESEKNVFGIVETASINEIQPTRKENPFVPEIFGLKDFSDDLVSPKYKFKLVDVLEHGNSYRKDEVIARNGETWLGLFSSNGESYLKNTKLKIDLDFDPEDPGAVIRFNKNKPLFLLKNAKKLKEGKITTLFQETSSEDADFADQTNTMNRGFVREFQLGERKYTLQIKDALTKAGETVIVLVLETEGFSQIVAYEKYFDDDYDGDYVGNLLWVGDLDGDGKLDLYMDFNDWEKGFFSSGLFLSSEAEKGKLVKEVAGFYTAGC